MHGRSGEREPAALFCGGRDIRRDDASPALGFDRPPDFMDKHRPARVDDEQADVGEGHGGAFDT
jgi:hypothetical protein